MVNYLLLVIHLFSTPRGLELSSSIVIFQPVTNLVIQESATAESCEQDIVTHYWNGSVYDENSQLFWNLDTAVDPFRCAWNSYPLNVFVSRFELIA